MQTNFTPQQLEDPAIAEAESILRNCVHCGFCTATCPTFTLLGDERDSPRGRIYLIKDMLENDQPAGRQVTTHIDRCLSCLSCMTTCPSGVHYMHLVDLARAHIHDTHRRPLMDRLMRQLLAVVLPYPGRFRLAVFGAFYSKPFAGLLKRMGGPFKRLGAMLALAPSRLPPRSVHEGARVLAAHGPRRGRVALMAGCAQPVLQPSINDATIRLLTRNGIEIVQAKGEGCCGALVHHMGREAAALDQARANVDAWNAQIDAGGLDAILITASGCGTTVKDYGFMLRHDPAYREKAARVSALTKDISEYLATLDLGAPVRSADLTIAYHSACSMQHGQKLTATPKTLLAQAGFTVRDVPEGHLCCGSAGVYNILQSDIADRLLRRKVSNIDKTGAAIIATGNIGCMTQIATATDRPIVHTVELIDWAHGGPLPAALAEAGIGAGEAVRAVEIVE